MTPRVTALIDTCNHERFIAQAIESVLAQDFPQSDLEVLVVDDGSTDGTGHVAQKFTPRVRYLRKPNGGQASAFNAGVREAHGEIVAFLDGDDWWVKEKLRVVVEAFEKNPEAGAVGHGLFEVDEAGARRFTNVPDRAYRNALRTVEEGVAFRELRSFLGTSRLAIRKGVLDSVLPLPEEMVIEADEFLAAVAVALGGVVVLDQPLTCYRLHSGNLYQFAAHDPPRMKRKYRALACLVRDLPVRLAAAGTPPDVVEAVMASVRVETERLRLSLEGGAPWETFRVERAARRLAYKDVTAGYRLFHALVLAAGLVLPPRTFYRARQWYADRGLARLRKAIGEPTPTDSLVERKATT